MKITNTIKLLFIAVVVILLQTILFNNENIFRWVTPLIYTFYVFYFPVKERAALLLTSFALGMFLDFAMNTSGLQCFATTLIAYLREPLWRNFSLIRNEHRLLSRVHVDRPTFFLSLFCLILIHYIAIYSIEMVQDFFLWKNLYQILLRSLASFVLIFITYTLFNIRLIDGEK